MELTHTIDCTCRVSAGLDETGLVRLKVFASAEYAKGASATVQVQSDELPSSLKEQVEKALQAVMDHVQPQLGGRLVKALVKSTEVAASFGEI